MTTRGTTPIHVFNVDTDLRDAEVVYVTYKQGSNKVLEKEKSQLTIGEKSIELKLTQQETIKFKKSLPVRVQIRARYIDGTAIASNIIETTVNDILKEGVI